MPLTKLFVTLFVFERILRNFHWIIKFRNNSNYFLFFSGKGNSVSTNISCLITTK